MSTLKPTLKPTIRPTPTPTVTALVICAQVLYDDRNLLALSNLAMLLPIIYCIKISKHWTDFICELIIMSITMFNSMFYHFCDVKDCAAFCLYQWKTAFKLDFIFSYDLIPTMVFYLVELKFSLLKVVLHIAVLFANTMFVLYYNNAYNNKVYFVIVTVCSIFLITCRLLYLIYTKQLIDEIKYNFDFIDAGVAAVLAIVGFSFKVSDSEDYPLRHSAWHLAIMTSLFFTFHIYNPDYTLFFFKRNRKYNKVNTNEPNEPNEPKDLEDQNNPIKIEEQNKSTILTNQDNSIKIENLNHLPECVKVKQLFA